MNKLMIKVAEVVRVNSAKVKSAKGFNKVLPILVILVSIVAVLTVSSASMYFFKQEKAPKALSV